MEYSQLLKQCADAHAKIFDKEAGLLSFFVKDNSGGYHTKRTGVTHGLRPSATYAAVVLCNGFEAYYPQALQILERLCELQDTRVGSPTFGLWSYNVEDDLEHMLAPDYNLADFIGKSLQEIILFGKSPLTQELRGKVLTAIHNAAVCSIRRNAGLDYSNIAVMSSLTITCAGEILQDPELFTIGKTRLERLCAYTRFNGAFSEYNSSTYIVTVLGDVSRMLRFFRDPQCLEMARELNYYAWKMVATHYNCALGQLTPPQARSYRDLENGVFDWMLWCGTGEKFGAPMPDLLFRPEQEATLEIICEGLTCPEELLPYFAQTELFLADTYYKKNDIRCAGEDFTIIREADSPDLTAWSFRTEKLSMGAFAFCDCWNQRRNCMVVWDKAHPKFFRLRGINNNYDFCSGVTSACQDHNRILGQLGLVTDRGTFHYILDKSKNGVYETDSLYFQFILGGDTGDLRVEQEGKDFIIRDGEITVTLHVETWVFDGKKAPVYISEDGKSVILEGYLGEKKVLDTNTLGKTYGVFTLTAEDASHKAEPAALSYRESGDKVISTWGDLNVTSCTGPVPYRTALGLDR